MCLDYTYSQSLKELARGRHLVSILILIFILNSIGSYKSEILTSFLSFYFLRSRVTPSLGNFSVYLGHSSSTLKTELERL